MPEGETREELPPVADGQKAASATREGARRLRESDLRVILDSTTDGILAVDDHGSTITTNHRFAAMWRIPQSILDTGDDGAMLSFVLDQLVDPDAFLSKVKALYGTTDLDMDTLHFKDGRVFERYSAPLVQDGAAIGRVWSFRDVTERRQLEAERLKAQRLEAIGVLAGGIAHDFNNLLQGVFGCISMARTKLRADEPAFELLVQAERALQRAVGLTGQLLTFSKGGRPVRKRITLPSLIEDATRLALSGSSSMCQLSIGGDLRPVEADEGQIAQVIHNIVLNASEAMPRGGTVEIAAENVDLPPGGHPAHPGGGRFVRITIRDSGIGIPDFHRSRIFDPYFTTKQAGSGLGLATSYSILKNHGGSIEVDSLPESGSTFTILLPASDSPAPSAPVEDDGQPLRRARVLVMDDEPVVRDVIGKMLDVLGQTVEFAEDGGAAVESYRRAMEAGATFDLVVLDMTVRAGMGGRQALEKLKALDPAVNAVVSSGYSDDPTVAEYISLGFRAFLPKPFDLDGLRSVLRTVLQ